MNEYRLQVELTPEARRKFTLESERKILKLEIKETKREINKRLKAVFAATGINLLVYAITKYFFPNFSINIVIWSVFGSWAIFEAIYLLSIWRKQNKALKKWNETAALVENSSVKNLES